MADFCFQCNIDLMFGPYSDFDKSDQGRPDNMLFSVLCEGCGYVIVDVRGRCRDNTCTLHRGDIPPVRSEVYRSAERWLRRRSGPLGPLLRLRDRFLGTPWEPGTIHLSSFWITLRQLWRDLLTGETVAGRHLLNQLQMSKIRCTINYLDPNNLEMFFYGTAPSSTDGEAPPPA